MRVGCSTQVPHSEARQRSSFTTRLYGVALVVLLTLRSGFAQDAASPTIVHPGISGYAEVAVADKYIYHGYIAADRGPVVQPYVELFGEFYRSGGFINSASLRLSVFNSFQPGDGHVSHMGEPLRSWYEVQIEPGIELMLAKAFTFTASYRRFDSPNGAFGSSDGIELSLAADDRAMLGAFALHPRFSWITPLPTETRTSSEAGQYFEANLAPTATFGSATRVPVTVTLPIGLGFGDSRYYFGRHFGFLSAGVAATVPLTFVPPELGAWKFGGSATYYYLGRTPADFTNGGDHSTGIFAATVSTAF